MHLVSLTFDDGFRKSSELTATIFESFGQRASINPVAWAHEPDFVTPEPTWGKHMCGDWAMWRGLAARGHEVMPHGLVHINKASIRFADAANLIARNIAIFETEMPGFDRTQSIYNFPYNATTPEIEAWLPTVIGGFRGGHIQHGINPLPTAETRVVRTCGHGPTGTEQGMESCIEELFKRPEGWLVYNLHGLDGEGWGEISSDYLRRTLDRLLKRPGTRLSPVAAALNAARRAG
ncbi:MAG: hypothetical protein NTW19_03570 [Planctomycetota bacterium]|nr:hypothetical protein [Planctomycetota bacterium]